MPRTYLRLVRYRRDDERPAGRLPAFGLYPLPGDRQDEVSFRLVLWTRWDDFEEIGVIRFADSNGPWAPHIGSIGGLPASVYSLAQSFSVYERLSSLDEGLGARLLDRLRDVVVDPRRRANAEVHARVMDWLVGDDRAERALEDGMSFWARSRELSDADRAAQIVHFEPSDLDGDPIFMDIPSSDLFESSIERRSIARIQIGNRAVDIPLDFRALLDGVSPRVVALIGDNGSGKSRTLAELATLAVEGATTSAAYVEGRPRYARTVFVSYGAFDQYSLPRTIRNGEQDPRVSKRSNFVYCGLRSLDAAGQPTDRLKSRLELEGELRAGLSAIASGARLKPWLECIAILAEATEFPVDPIDLASAFGQVGSSSIELSGFSSGQLVVLTILINVIASLEPGSFVLIDEPEVHLHPPLVSALLRGILRVLSSFDSFAVVATHSPVVLQELTSDRVIVFERFGRETIVRHPDIQTLGENVSAITRDVFRMAGRESDYASALRQAGRSLGVDETSNRIRGLSVQGRAIALLAETETGHRD